MSLKPIFIISSFLVIVYLVWFGVSFSDKTFTGDDVVSITQATIVFPNGETLMTDVADTKTEQIKGLSDQAYPHALLFVFTDESIRSFWMKDMLFAIDILWIKDGEIMGIEKGLEPETPAKTIYNSPIPLKTVLELPAGTVDEFGLKVGDRLDIQLDTP